MGRVDIYPSSVLQLPPSSTLAYSENTVGQSLITATTDLTGLAVTVTVPTGRRIRVTGFLPSTGSTVAGDGVRMQIMEGANRLSLAQDHMSGSGIGAPTMIDTVVLTPTAGTHTYKLTLERASGTGTVSYSGDPTFPAYILVEDVTGTLWNGTQVTAGMIALEGWAAFTPVITQVGNVTFTVNYSKYIQLGKTVIWNAALTVTGSGTAGTGANITIPVTSSSPVPGPSFGAGQIFDTSATISYGGEWVPNAGSSVVFVGDWAGSQTWGNTPSIGLASGDFIRLSLVYEAA